VNCQTKSLIIAVLLLLLVPAMPILEPGRLQQDLGPSKQPGMT
jgi:hypothetical protein